MRFLVDAQLPPALARFLRDRRHDAKAVREVGLRDAEDVDIWNYALKEGAAVITKDEDFALRAMSSNPCPAIIWLRVGNCSNRALLVWFEPLLPTIEKALAASERLIEVI
jgi:predicted nuclease of predicted toxin-antitoxin system